MSVHQRSLLGLQEAHKAADAVLEEASRRKPFWPISVAIVDICGDLIYFAKLDGSLPNQVQVAQNKAYTSAMLRRSTRVFGEFNRGGVYKGYELSLTTWGNPRYTDIPGGICITSEDGIPLAGIGVSGIPTAEGDEELALFGPKAIGLPYK